MMERLVKDQETKQPASVPAPSTASTFYGRARSGLCQRTRHAKNDADNRRLWEVSEQLTGVTYPKPS